jgi:DNA-directed RNA polymerase specialized sigma24 family protein
LPDNLPAPRTQRVLADDDELASNLETMMTEEVRRLLEKLGNAQLRRIAIAKLEDYTNEEIAIEHDCSVRTIERRLNLIRKKWKSERA